jgi:hypothetical protein
MHPFIPSSLPTASAGFPSETRIRSAGRLAADTASAALRAFESTGWYEMPVSRLDEHEQFDIVVLFVCFVCFVCFVASAAFAEEILFVVLPNAEVWDGDPKTPPRQ